MWCGIGFAAAGCAVIPRRGDLAFADNEHARSSKDMANACYASKKA